MELPFRRITVILLVAALFPLDLFAAEPKARPRPTPAPNPIVDFFKRLGNSIAHPKSSPAPRKSSRKRSTRTSKKPTDAVSGTAIQGEPEANSNVEGEAPPPPTPTPEPTPAVKLVTRPTPAPRHAPMPVPIVVRSAVGVPPPNKRPLPDLPFGIPIPNKPGFVTSPYAPKAGYVDVRGFASGSLVKDPYTGKNFLVP